MQKIKNSSILFLGMVLVQPALSESSTENSGIDWVAGKLNVSIDTQKYSWKSEEGAKGGQNVTPLTVNYKYGNTVLGLRAAKISSSNKTPDREGSVSTMSDTALSLAHELRLKDSPDWSFRFNLDYNAPTGKASLVGREKLAIMDGNLVSQTRFGEGENITPGIVVTKAFTKNLSLGLGFSKTNRGEYDPNGDVENDILNPGNEERLTLQGQYATKDMMILGGLIYTDSESTRVEDIEYFQKGKRQDINLTGIFSLPLAQRLTIGARYGKQDPDSYINFFTGNFEKESFNINGESKYISVAYSKGLNSVSNLNITADWLEIKANSYDQFNDLYNAGREKYSLSASYDYMFNANSRASLSVTGFEMKDKATPATLVDTKYSGNVVSVNLAHKF